MSVTVRDRPMVAIANVNRKSYVADRYVSVPMTLSDLVTLNDTVTLKPRSGPGFQVSQVEYLKDIVLSVRV